MTAKLRSIVITLLFAGTFLAGTFVGAQTKPAPAPAPTPAYQPTEMQSLRLQLAQQKIINAQQSFQLACGDGVKPGTLGIDFQGTMNALSVEAEKVKKENKWPEDVQFNGGTLTFSAPPLPTPSTPPPTPAKPAEPAKKS